MGGTCGKVTAEDKAAADKSRAIDKELLQAKKKATKEVKLLLLGAGASGKSTVAKQMHILYLNGFGENELAEYKAQIATNMVNNMRNLLLGAQKLGIPISNSLKQESQTVLAFEEDDEEIDWTSELYDAIRTLWADQGIAAAFQRSNEFQLSDSTRYFFDNLERYKDLKNYHVTDEDILHVRKRTTGIAETKFSHNGLNFTMVDVGGQRNERKKWIHCFEDVTAIIFVAALSEYDQVLEEDNTTNRMVESLKLFEDTINNDWFNRKPIILFLNKVDIFEQKLVAGSSLGDYFSDFKGGSDVSKAKKWVHEQYDTRNHAPNRQVYIHLTTATDTSNIQMVFDACKDIWLSEALDTFNF
jgi:GTPase SAR1 family protein